MPVAQPWAPPSPGPRLPGPRAVADVLTGGAEVCMHLQPIVALSSGSIWGVEALARFPGHPRPGPDAWFVSAGRDGRAQALEELALAAALAALPLLPDDLRLTINLSARSLLHPRVRDRLTGLPPDRVLVELTEHERVGDYPVLVAALGALRAAGVGLAIDDFGAGHSSLQHVLQLEPEMVKLDLALVQGVGECPRKQAVLEAMLTFCRRTDALLVAEGVEEGDDLQRLGELGVELAQGFFLARPAPPEVVLPVLVAPGPPVLVLP